MPAKKTTKTVRQKPQQMVDFGTAISNFWTKYVDFNGTAQRSEYWFAQLFCIIVSWPLSLMALAIPEFSFLKIIWGFATFLPGMALVSRRFHDAGYSAKLWWIPTLCLSGATLFFIMLIIIAEETHNEELMALVIGFLVLVILAWIAFGIFWFVVTLTPSKLKDNPYRK